MNTNQIIWLVSKVRVKASAFLENELMDQGIDGLIASHGSVISALFHHNGKLKMKDIADKVNRDKSTITYLVNGLCKAGYVTREKSHEDSRETYIVLTQKAWDIKEKVDAISRKLITTVYQGFTDAEKVQLTQLLSRVKDNLE